jgi:hypothetical protein
MSAQCHGQIHYITPLFVVLSAINVPAILYNQFDPNYPSYIVTLIV